MIFPSVRIILLIRASANPCAAWSMAVLHSNVDREISEAEPPDIPDTNPPTQFTALLPSTMCCRKICFSMILMSGSIRYVPVP